ncbi:MAG: hypothetical protein EOM41_00675 [Bacilli bacterium]|nr:hypothetical protein [Bacilli bacterium]
MKNSKTVTLKTLIANSSIPATLIRAVVKNMGGWKSFKESAQDVVDHGASCGFGNFIYYTDTVAFTAKNRKAIAAYAAEQSKEIGYKDEIEMILSFKCLQGFNDPITSSEIAKALYGRLADTDTKTIVYNALAWYALEEVALAYCDLLDQE